MSTVDLHNIQTIVGVKGDTAIQGGENDPSHWAMLMGKMIDQYLTQEV